MPDRLSRHQITVLIVALMATAMGQSLVFAILAPLGREVQLGTADHLHHRHFRPDILALAAPPGGVSATASTRKPIIITGLVGCTSAPGFTSVFTPASPGWLAGIALYGVLLAGRCSQSIVMSATSPPPPPTLRTIPRAKQRTEPWRAWGQPTAWAPSGPAVSGTGHLRPVGAAVCICGVMAALAALLVWRQLPPRRPGRGHHPPHQDTIACD